MGPPDWGLLAVVLSLVFLGVVLVFDASVVRANDAFGGKYYFLILQSAWAFGGIIVLYFLMNFNYQRILEFSPKLILLSLIFLTVTALPRFLPGGMRATIELFVPLINGSHRWIMINPSPLPSLPLVGRQGFQPSELAKISLVLYLAYLLKAKRSNTETFKALLAVVFLSGLILWQPDFGTALIVSLTGLSVYFLSGPPVRNFIFLIAILFVLSLIFVLGSSYRRQRLFSYIQPSSEQNLSSRYQINQVLIALGSGGFWGLGLGQSRQKYDYVPEVNTDSIFSILGEELGLVGVTSLLLLFFFLFYKGFVIASVSESLSGSLLASGIVSFLALQTLINLAGMVHLLPLTGVPLPLISYGGSSLVSNMAALGILLNISRSVRS